MIWGLTACKPSEVYACQEKKWKHCTSISTEKCSQYLEDICLYLLKHKSSGPGTHASKSDSICMFFLTHKSSCMQNGMNNAGTELPEWIIFHWKVGIDGLPSRSGLGTRETHARTRRSSLRVCVPPIELDCSDAQESGLCDISSFNALSDNNNS